MKVDVVIPTYNRSGYLKRALDSVFNQTYKYFEVWVIDDASTDETKEVVKNYQNLFNFNYVVLNENLGVSGARNFGVAQGKADWIAFLDSDDEWLPNKLALQIDYIQGHPEVPLVHGEEIWYRNLKRVNPKKIHKKYGGFIFERCLPLCLISPSATMIKRDVLKSLGGFDAGFVVCEDYDLWLKVTSSYPVGFIETPVINKYGGHDNQLSAKFFAMDFWRVKSMNNLLKRGDLDSEKQQLVRSEIIKKSQILILGYKKHQNFKDLPFIENTLENAKNIPIG